MRNEVVGNADLQQRFRLEAKVSARIPPVQLLGVGCLERSPV